MCLHKISPGCRLSGSRCIADLQLWSDWQLRRINTIHILKRQESDEFFRLLLLTKSAKQVIILKNDMITKIAVLENDFSIGQVTQRSHLSWWCPKLSKFSEMNIDTWSITHFSVYQYASMCCPHFQSIYPWRWPLRISVSCQISLTPKLLTESRFSHLLTICKYSK